MDGTVEARCRRCYKRFEVPAADYPPRDGACPHCGISSSKWWVQVGSFAEYYAFWQYPDVCRLGEHRSSTTKSYAVRHPPPEPRVEGAVELVALYVNCCDECLPRLDLEFGGPGVEICLEESSEFE